MTEAPIRTRGLVRGKDTISVDDYQNHPGLRKMIARSLEWRWSEYVMAWVRDPGPLPHPHPHYSKDRSQ